MENSLYDKIIAAQQGNEESTLDLINAFSPLLKKYAFLLSTEDSYEELQYFLIDFIKNINTNGLNSSSNGAIINYISKVIYHQYITLSKANRQRKSTVYIQDMNEYDTMQYDSRCGESDDYNQLLIYDLKRTLTAKEFSVIYALIFKGLSVTEIAENQGISRQAVNQMKNSAIKKLRIKWGTQQKGIA